MSLEKCVPYARCAVMLITGSNLHICDSSTNALLLMVITSTSTMDTDLCKCNLHNSETVHNQGQKYYSYTQIHSLDRIQYDI